ncbi:hypothetical protein [Ruminococcus sp.]
MRKFFQKADFADFTVYSLGIKRIFPTPFSPNAVFLLTSCQMKS